MLLDVGKISIICCVEAVRRKGNIARQLKAMREYGIENEVEMYKFPKMQSLSGGLNETVKDGLDQQFKHQSKMSVPHMHALGSFGCAIAHYTVIKDAYLRGFENILIFEDDFRINDMETFEHTVNAFRQSGFDYANLILGRNNDSELFLRQALSSDDISATVAYMLSRKGMEYFIDRYENDLTYSDNIVYNIRSVKDIKLGISTKWPCCYEKVDEGNIDYSFKK